MAAPSTRESSRLLVVTPHLGDAVIGCGELLAAHPGAVVVTVFAGIPASSYVVPEWDAACGFSSPQQAVTVRRREERSALETLDAEPCWLACPESQYRRSIALDEVARRLGRALRRHRAERIAVPLGLVRGDHMMAAEAAMRLYKRGDQEWLVYEDFPAPDAEGRLARFHAEPFVLEDDEYFGYLKRRAADNYASLKRGLSSVGRELRPCLDTPERYWRISSL